MEWDKIEVTDNGIVRREGENLEGNEDAPKDTSTPKKEKKVDGHTRTRSNASKLSSILLKYPLCGQISRCTDRGFGFVNGPQGEEWIHLRDHTGQRLNTMEGLEGNLCAFVIGGHPFRHSQRKPGWDRSVVQWLILDDVDPSITTQTYATEREKALSGLDKERLLSLLCADWYLRLWQNKMEGPAKAPLKGDKLLDQTLINRLAGSDGIADLIQLLAAICASPWYGLTQADRARVCQRFFQPSDWPLSVFLARKPLSSCRGYSDIWPLCGETLGGYIRKAVTVAVDLESDEDAIFEFGWKNAAGTDLRANRSGLSKEELTKAVEDCLCGQNAPCIVGHNLLSWDWPILQQHEAPFPASSALWDTLVASWILEPWNPSHALIAGEHAHRADADSEACYELFESQIARLEPCIDGAEFDLRKLVDRLFDDLSMLSQVQDREYPADLRKSSSAAYVYPSNRSHEIAWQRNCYLALVAPENSLSDPVLSPEICRKVAARQGDIPAKVASIVISDAAEQDVRVRLSRLPQWLADETYRSLLRDAHADCTDTPRDDVKIFYLAEDLFKLADAEVESYFTDGQLAIAHPGDIIAIWQRLRRLSLTEQEARRVYPGATERRTGRALLSVTRDDDTAAWLLYEPPGLNARNAAWSLLPRIPDWLQAGSALAHVPLGMDAWACVPRWRDGDATRLDVDRLFVSPDTANRPLYLSDLTHCLLNILRAAKETEVVLLGMRWREEAEKMQRDLVQLSLSSQHPGTPLRQLEHICSKGHRVLACERSEISKFVKAAGRLGKAVRIVLDEVPLHDWHAILERPVVADATVTGQTTADIPDAGSEDDDSSDTEPVGQKEHAGQQTILTGNDVRTAVHTFLVGWLQGLIDYAGVESTPCLILDARLTSRHAAKATQVPKFDVPFYSLEELLDHDALQVFFAVCYPRRDEKAIPNEYEAYRSFLEANWGYRNFRPGTQRPAIQKLIETKRDILLRLPTGAGKSIIFHLPALLRSKSSGRLTVVITPLRALMRDQVEGLWRKHFTESVDYLSGGRDAWINYEVYQGILDGRIRLVFVAPERFRVPRFTEALERRRRMDDGLEFVVFDETHCISEWGFEFRPDYLHAAQYVAEWFKTKELPGNPHRLLLTSATVTQRNRVDLERELGLGAIDPYEDLPEDMPHPIQPYIVLDSFDLHEDEEAPSDAKFDKIVEILGGLNLHESAALVFVRRRKDCHRIGEALNTYATRIDSPLAALHALPFHAGLPEAVKTEACDLLRERKANVLVCTKAFGMGMDIPHLHACIHHRPPTFIEDYLQEVGRVGRDEQERIHTGHDHVVATLLYNQENIERNLGLLHDKTVTPPDLQDFFGFCLSMAVFFENVGKSLCVIPATVRLSETRAFDENQVTNCLFWLERMKVLRVEGRHPPFLDLGLDLPGLRRHADGSTLPSRVAEVLLGIVDESRSVVGQLATPSRAATSPAPSTENIFGRVVKGLLRGVLALISPSSQVAAGPQAPAVARTYSVKQEDRKVEASISMTELISSCGGISMDDLFLGLFELSRADVLSVKKVFVVLKNGVPSGDEFWDLLQTAITRLLRPTGGKVELLSRNQFEAELKEWYRDFLSKEPDEGTPDAENRGTSTLLTRQIQREVYRAISTSLKILRYAGVALQETLSDAGVAQYARSIPDSIRSSTAGATRESFQAMQKLLACVATRKAQSVQTHGATFEVLLTDIMDALGPEVGIGVIKELMKLVETAGFYGFDGALNDWVSVVTLNTQQALAPHEPEVESDSLVQSVYTEMLEKYELQVLRAQAMVLLAAMPAENRKEYIDRYFQCVTAEDLEGLLEDTVGDVEDDVLASNPMLQELLGQVRRERFSEEVDRLNENQLGVCRAPFDRTLLVNAGPGSGKTHVLMMRCAHLIHVQRVDPAAILVLAFNRAVVYEIRDRVRSLFRALGYGSYANRLDVSTFHSFALRHQQTTDLFEEDAIGQAVHTFAEAMGRDADFARVIGGRYKAVLVDEFQDMNEDFYAVVTSLLTHCGGGGMVIGDDDQDILTWNRRDWQRKHRRDCPLDAVHYFSTFRESLQPEQHQLTLNYRSVPEVVERANGMIAKVSSRVGFSRMKEGNALTAFRTEHGAVVMPLDPAGCTQLAMEALARNENTALLCRSNRECRQIYETLIGSGGITENYIDLLGAEDFSLYQLRHCGALLDICRTRNEYEFVESFIWEELLHDYEQRGFADLQNDRDYLATLYTLIKEEVGRPRMRDIQAFILEMRASDVERLKAKVGLVDVSAKLTVATVHKVKGLEYDTVLVMPSTESFPFRRVNGGIPPPEAVDAAEEARLCYVGMTRARNRLFIGWGERENQWLNCARYDTSAETHRYCLKGSPKELFVSWPGQEPQVRGGLQEYIEKQISLGDQLSLRGPTVHHGNRVVGRLSRQTADRLQQGPGHPALRVSNVIRYTCGRYFREHNPRFWEPLDNRVKRQGWFYIVLVEES